MLEVEASHYTGPPQTDVQVAQAEILNDSETILEIQRSLANLGFDPGPADGVFGSQTRRAIEEAQRQLGWNADGVPSQELVQVLRQALAARDQTEAVPEASVTEETVDNGADESETAPAAPVQAASKTRESAGTQTAMPERPEEMVQPETTEPASESGPQPQTVYALAGSKWSVADSTGASFTLVFRPDGSVRGPALHGEWSWRTEGNAVAIEYRSGVGYWVKRQGALDGADAMRGTGQSSIGNSWTWNATRMR